MTRLRVPVVAGVTAGVGTTTVAAALHGLDGGVVADCVDGPAARRLTDLPAGGVDVLVCRGDAASLHRLAVLVGTAGPVDPVARPGPVLAVMLDAGVTDTMARGRILADLWPLRPRSGRVTVLPYVATLQGKDVSRTHLGMLLGRRPEQLGSGLRRFADAVRGLAATLVAAGVLTTPPAQLASPMQAPGRDQASALWRGLGPVERRRGVETAAVLGSGDELDDYELGYELGYELDDYELEAAQAWRAAG